MTEEEKRIAHQQYQYGTFQQPPDYQPSAPYSHPSAPYSHPSAPPSVTATAVDFSHPVAPPFASGGSQPPPYYHPSYPPAPAYYANGYQAIPVAEGRPVLLRMQPLPFCGMGIGWFLFITGFFLAAIPWYVGAFILLFVRVDYREKPGFVACTIAAVLTAVAVLVGATKEGNVISGDH